MSSKNQPVVGIATCHRLNDRHYFHVAGEKYISAVNNFSNCAGILVPAILQTSINESILDTLDGFLLTGSLSNVHPKRYNEEIIDSNLRLDETRDACVFSLIHSIIERKMPLLAICRGFQEMNIAFGGTLYQDLERDSKYRGHDFDRDEPTDIQYGISHDVVFEHNGLLQRITGAQTAQVNSLHTQGVKQLGDGLSVEATSQDGLIEAFTVNDADGFNLSVQWHPEWQPNTSSVSTALFEYFGQTCKGFAEQS